MRRLHGEQQAAALNAVRTTLIAAFVAVIGLFTYILNRKGYFLSHRGQVAERYAKYVEQLSSGSPLVRVGAIHSLESVLAEAPGYHAKIVRTLAIFVRISTRAIGDPPAIPAEDVIAAMTVLACRPVRREDFQIDLSEVKLRGLNLHNGDLPGPARLHQVNLAGSDLSEANLSQADLSGAILDGANLSSVIADSASFEQVRLANANLTGAKLSYARFQKAELDGAVLNGAHLNHADLTDAWLDGAYVAETSFNCAIMTRASLGATDLSTSNLLRKNQVLVADLWNNTVLPEFLAHDTDVLNHLADVESRVRRPRPAHS
ncbi:pentapeptide repeat-containing protein [Streptomyces xylophagus]|uniref:pentapeptide repeat-containing protein n=1 Tax=Streptomyces xylophagus TaxID=285514 RepID=UPI00131B5AF8|nr:pentapeptide repeat-containing protein [Streptomyces xylophagus]